MHIPVFYKKNKYENTTVGLYVKFKIQKYNVALGNMLFAFNNNLYFHQCRAERTQIDTNSNCPIHLPDELANCASDWTFSVRFITSNQ